MTVRVGVLVNPIAGFGGMLALHGTDALPAELFDDAVRANRAGRRMTQALDAFHRADVEAELVPAAFGARTTRHDTIAAARAFLADGVDVLLFAGGDGTATDIAEAIGTGMPVIGIPSGVKMHSEVFSRSPVAAGRLLADFVRGHAPAELADVLDVGADGVSGVVGALLAPRSREVLQGAKSSAPSGSSAAAARAIARDLVAGAPDEVTWVIGPGTTAGAVAEELGFAPTLRGVDVRHASGEVELDVAEDRLHRVVVAAGHPRLVLGVVGGQGFLLGRGNQQLSPRVIDAIGVDNIDIVATPDKVGALQPPVLLVDVDEQTALVGYRRVLTGFRTSIVLKVVDAAAQLEPALKVGERR